MLAAAAGLRSPCAFPTFTTRATSSVRTARGTAPPPGPRADRRAARAAEESRQRAELRVRVLAFLDARRPAYFTAEQVAETLGRDDVDAVRTALTDAGDELDLRTVAGVYSYCARIAPAAASSRRRGRRARADRGAARPVALALAGAGAVLLLALLGLRLLPSPRSSPAELCASSPTPGACRALVNVGGAGPELGARRDLGAEVLDAPPARLLLAGLDALAAGNPVTAHRLCADAAREEGLDRAPALVCQGRAALRLGWPARAAFLAQRALELQDDAAAHVLVGDALEAQRDCRGARVEYLRALDVDPDNAAAAEGLRRCGGAPPPAPGPRDLTGDRDAEVADALA